MSGPAAEALEGEPLLMSLPDLYPHPGGFKCDPYIRAAVRLQGMGRESATEVLRALARKESSGGYRAIILCRMLFAKKTGGEFRGPALGRVVFLDFAEHGDWPLAPIEVIDGVPFLIVWCYRPAEGVETSEQYLDYCIANADWNGSRFKFKDAAKLLEALEKLDRSPKWKEPLGDAQRDLLFRQAIGGSPD